VSSLLSVLNELLDNIAQSVLDVSRDYLTQLIDEAYKRYYRVNPFTNTKASLVAFVDAGIYPLDFDVASLVYIQIGSLIRDEAGKLKSIAFLPQLKSYPFIERLILSVSRKRRIEEGRQVYKFDVTLRTPEKRSILFGDDKGAIEASKRITQTLDYIGLRVRYKSPSLYIKLTKYIEGLIEIAYGIRLIQYANEISKAVIDGTLVRWLRPKREKYEISYKGDGLDVLAAILDEDLSHVKKICLKGIVGLAKTTSFTTLTRSMSVFREHIKPSKRLYEYYTTVKTEELNNLRKMLIMAEVGGFENRPRIPHEVIVSIIKKFNTCVFPEHGVWVARFPLTMDGTYVMVLDMYMDKPIINYEIQVNENMAREVNKRVDEGVSEIFYAKSPLGGRPPTGFMELDESVRVTSEVRRDVENHLLAVVLRRHAIDDPVKWIILQAVLGASRMRYGYTG